eukprot:1596282-Prymnesium_polylepis.1
MLPPRLKQPPILHNHKKPPPDCDYVLGSACCVRSCTGAHELLQRLIRDSPGGRRHGRRLSLAEGAEEVAPL